MGLYFQLNCTRCGYRFAASYMGGSSETPRTKARERLEKGSDEPARVYRLLKQLGAVQVEVDTRPYWCCDCSTFYNYDRVILRGRTGEYVEKDGICPDCGKRTSDIWTIDAKELQGKDEDGYGICECRCPKGSTKLTVTGGDILD